MVGVVDSCTYIETWIYFFVDKLSEVVIKIRLSTPKLRSTVDLSSFVRSGTLNDVKTDEET